jgi:hypothetical protein
MSNFTGNLSLQHREYRRRHQRIAAPSPLAHTAARRRRSSLDLIPLLVSWALKEGAVRRILHGLLFPWRRPCSASTVRHSQKGTCGQQGTIPESANSYCQMGSVPPRRRPGSSYGTRQRHPPRDSAAGERTRWWEPARLAAVEQRSRLHTTCGRARESEVWKM